MMVEIELARSSTRINILIHPASEKDAADLQKRVLEKIGSYTDVVATVGGFSFAKTLLEFSAEEIRTVSIIDVSMLNTSCSISA